MTIENRRFFEVPHAAVYLLITANIVVFGLCALQSGGDTISSDVLFRSGAMYATAIERGEYWRLVTYGFLHANLLHLATNMICLALWGGHLEKRVGPFFFIVIYVCAMVAGAVVGRLTHPGPYLSVGASGGISGILGALLCLWILAKIDLTAGFFLFNLGLNAAAAFSVRNIDWGAHFGGFAIGLIACALIDVVEKANRFVLRCKFPEFVKINAFVVVGGVALVVWSKLPAVPTFGLDGWWPLLVVLLVGIIVIELCDWLLTVKKGLAVLVLMFAAANAVLVLYAGNAFAATFTWGCASRRFAATVEIEKTLLGAACADLGLTFVVAAAVAFVVTLLAYAQELQRGLSDVGFVDATLRAERRRRDGI